jgi:surfeit locus 1 family protein
VIKLQNFKFSIGSLLVTLTAFVILCKLGFWQLDRAEQKRQELKTFSDNALISSTQLTNQINNNQLAELNGKSIAFTAKLSPQYWLVDNKVHQGRVGYAVVATAFIQYLGDQDSVDQDSVDQDKQQQVLVDLGWWPAPRSRDELPNIKLPATITTTAVIKSQDLKQFTLQSEQQVGATRIQAHTEALAANESLPAMVLYAQSDTIAGHPQIYKPVVMPPEKHTAYAVQWFLLALASLIVYGFASYRRKPVSSTSQSRQSTQGNSP